MVATAAAAQPRGPTKPVQPALAAPAPAPPARRKPPTDAYPAGAIELFVDAVIADKAGDLSLAQRRYQDANRISEQAHTHYNIADVRRRMERWKYAVESYRKYLELLPTAVDRAEVEKLVAQIESRPGVAVIDGEEPGAIVLVDGKLMGPSPVITAVSGGRHLAERITAASYAATTFDVKAADTEHVRLNNKRDGAGNVILSGNVGFSASWHDNGVEYRIPGRMALDPGRHVTYLSSRDRACSPVQFDAPRADELVHVYIEAGEPERGSRCMPIKIRQTKLRLP